MALPRFDPPAGAGVSAPFWDGIERGVLKLPRCSACGAWQWYPDEMGPDCAGADFEWVEVPATGTVYSCSRVHRSFLPGGRYDVPYVVGCVELDGADGVRLVCNLDDDPELQVGSRVEGRSIRHEERGHLVFSLSRRDG